MGMGDLTGVGRLSPPPRRPTAVLSGTEEYQTLMCKLINLVHLCYSSLQVVASDSPNIYCKPILHIIIKLWIQIKNQKHIFDLY